MKKPRYYITLNSEETRLVLRSLIRMKNRLIQEISIPSQSVTHLYCMLFLWQIMRDRLASGKLTRAVWCDMSFSNGLTLVNDSA